jgi:hypothetical protein
MKMTNSYPNIRALHFSTGSSLWRSARASLVSVRRSLRSTAISLFFFVGRGFCSLLRFAAHVVLHRLSIRTLCEPSWPCAGWGSVLTVFGRPLKPKRDTQSSEHGVITTDRHHRINSSSSVEWAVLFLGDPDPVEQRGQVFGQPRRWLDFVLACLRAMPGAIPPSPLS